MSEYRPSGFRILPPVVKGLILVNVIVFLVLGALEKIAGIDLTHYLAFHYPSSPYFMPHQFISYMFLHGNVAHIFFNMFSFWMFGTTLENYWGSKRFLTYYLVTGMGAALVHTGYMFVELKSMEDAIAAYVDSPGPDAFLAFLREHLPYVYENMSDPHYEALDAFASNYLSNPASPELTGESIEFIQNVPLRSIADNPTVGASGAVFGILLAFGMIFPNAMLYLYFAIPMKAKYFVIMYGALELYLGYRNNPTDNVAHFAHLGGMLFGYLLIVYWRRKRRV